MPSLSTIALLAINLSLVVGVLLPRWSAPGRLLRGIAGRRALANLVVASVAFATAWSVARRQPFPPNFHDEFSLLLMADTFASGRLSNPTPPLPEHFESPHILLRPTYASKHPVMQGIALAAGQVLSGDPSLGLQLSFALVCFLCCWMMQGWLPGRWAFLSTACFLASILHLGFDRPKLGGGWGGEMSASGAALVYGAIARLRFGPFTLERDAQARVAPRAPRIRCGWSLGLIVLANSRPFEGLAASLPAGVVFLRWFIRQVRKVGWGRSMRCIAPLLLVLAAGLGAMMIYFKAVTGNPLRMPYFEHDARYAVAPSFWLQQMKSTPSTYFRSDGSLDPLLERRYRFHHGYEKKCREDYDGSENLLRLSGRQMVDHGRLLRAGGRSHSLRASFGCSRSRRT